MIPIVYDTLLVLMLFVLYRCGKEMVITGKIKSKAGLTAIIIYTLNIGLRFGRGIDYNEYWHTYYDIAKGWDSNRDFFFVFFVKMLSGIGIPFQGFILFESFMFILGTLLFLRNYREILPYALPLFVLFSMYDVENMVRWYLGYSFVLVGLSYLLKGKVWSHYLFSMIGCAFHIGLLPIPIFFHLFYYYRKPLFHPMLSILLFIAIGKFFQTDFMLNFTELFNMISVVSERAEGYANNAEVWLTGGFNDRFREAFPRKSEMVFMFLVIWLGFKVIKNKHSNCVFVYNLFVIGFLLKPLANMLELVWRYDSIFYFFIGIVCAWILKDMFVTKIAKNRALKFIFVFSFLYISSNYFIKPFVDNPKKFMYVWNHDKETYDYMIQMWTDENDNNANNAEKNNRGK